MSRYIEVNSQTGKNEIWLDDPKRCRFLYNGICCNGKSRYVTEIATSENCKFCRHFKKETLKVGQINQTSITERM